MSHYCFCKGGKNELNKEADCLQLKGCSIHFLQIFSGPTRCKKSCSRTYTPLCGTDGVTYDNLCQYSNARCDNKALKISFKGKCEGQYIYIHILKYLFGDYTTTSMHLTIIH